LRTKELKIDIHPDKENKRIGITNTGIGMTRTQLISNLGTIARSGIRQFMQVIEGGADLSLIGQFDVGSFSVFLVATELLSHQDMMKKKKTNTSGKARQVRNSQSEKTNQR
jgi:HSP90 family molecular chaperone